MKKNHKKTKKIKNEYPTKFEYTNKNGIEYNRIENMKKNIFYT